ncbi:MAG TPA: DUF1559 domain-containing protein [Fimbriiglobus sp.]|jgi:hypothetical protein|nr:DUF1559 domain-containing protein [Fimbriiglobus sp.]
MRIFLRPVAAAVLAGLAVALALTAPDPRQAVAQPKSDGDLPADLAMVPADALGFVHVRLADVWKHDALKEYRRIIEKAGPQALAALDSQFVPPPSTIDRITAVALPPQGDRSDPSVLAILSFSAPFDSARVRSAYLPDVKPQKAGGREFFADDRSGVAVHFPNDRTLVFGDVKTIPAFLGRPAKADGGLAVALKEAAQNKAVFAAVNVKALPIPPQFSDNIPPEIQPLLKTDHATVSVELGTAATVRARLVYANAEDAQAAEKALKKAADMGRVALVQPRRQAEDALYKKDAKSPRPLDELPEALGAVAALGGIATLDEILADLPVKRDGVALAAEVALPPWATGYVGLAAVSAGLGLPAVQKVREAASRTQSMNNMKQIALAMHNYHDAYGALPPAAIVDRKGKKLLSWRVMILPYIEQDNLYKQFKLDEPWDSEHNKKLIPMMPKTYADPRMPYEPGKTYYKVFVGKNAGFDWLKGHKFPGSFPDGTSNTIMTAAAGEPVVWTKPDDFEFDAEKGPPDLSKPFPNVLVGMFDGSVRVLNPKISRDTLKHAIMRDDGMVLGNDF